LILPEAALRAAGRTRRPRGRARLPFQQRDYFGNGDDISCPPHHCDIASPLAALFPKTLTLNMAGRAARSPGCPRQPLRNNAFCDAQKRYMVLGQELML